ncbi:MAG TPA: phosphoglucosamine mutase [Pyrinomonadaceae bacterium]|nr:phosphoglucosamine mutase [Acidobacteriota bacterium]HQZ96535.1 phosphoglucosamine mutase [Pyrinomonadaceae bacterium]
MKQLFGTDGIRGLAGEFPLDEKTVQIIGAALARQFREKLGRDPKFISGRDTRESGHWIETAFRAGAAAENADCKSAGVITTPGVAYLTKAFDFDAGIVISASHNPFQDNGIKIFLPTGSKIDEATERLIERDIYDERVPQMSAAPHIDADAEAKYQLAYANYLSEAADHIKINHYKIVVDCANGAASDFVPRVFNKFGGGVVVINNQPDGRNINANCGSLHLEHLQARVLEEKADIGVAFDGDADRALFVDENGKIVDGDATLWIMAQYLQDHGKLANATVVATVMSNIGLELALRSKDIKLLRASVGDKYVLEQLLETGSEVGGEQSGHIIFPRTSLVGDGMMTALTLLRAISERGLSLSQATEGFVAYPQILINVKVGEKRPFDQVPEIVEAAKIIEGELHGEGRMLLRYSGTENLARVMIEGKDQASIEAQAKRLADVIGSALG